MYAARYLINNAMHRGTSLFDSPDDRFILDFKDHVLNAGETYAAFSKIDAYRSILYHNKAFLEKVNLGAGSRSPDKRKTVGETARITSVKPKYGRLLYRIAMHYKPACIIELGSAFGISTMYLALGNSQASVITVEGNPQVAGIAVEGYTYMGISNITMLQNSFDKVVPELSHIQEKSKLVFIDGNHTMEATLEYYGKFRANTSCAIDPDIR